MSTYPLIFPTSANLVFTEADSSSYFPDGYTPCYKAATDATDNGNGHHICGPKDGYSRTSRRRSPDREKGAIDHCFIYNAQEGVAVKVFDCITARITVKLTDHYPYLIDAAL